MKISEAIPHRPPFLFVDEILETSDRRIVALWRADETAPFFRGHFPGNPVVPGVLLCEVCFQAGALLMAGQSGIATRDQGFPAITRIQDARFKRIVRPNEQVRVEVTLDDSVDRAFFMTARATVEGQLAVRVSFACMMILPGSDPE